MDGDEMRRLVLESRESRQAKDAVAVGASGIAPEGDGKQLEGAFLLLEGIAVYAPKDLILAERCREDCVRRGNGIGGPERSEAGLAVGIQIKISIHRGDALLGALAAVPVKPLWMAVKPVSNGEPPCANAATRITTSSVRRAAVGRAHFD